MNPWFLVGALVAICAAFTGGYWRGNEAGQAFVQQQWDQERAKQMAEYAENQRIAREKEQAMQLAADNIRKEKDREIRNLNARAAALTNSLRDRSERPTTQTSALPSTTTNGSTTTGCTGKELYRPDGEFLAREAARADELRILLRQCYKQYQEVSQPQR
jgi:hypothetical protein